VSLFSRLKSVVTGDDYLDGDYDDDLEYDEPAEPSESGFSRGGALASIGQFEMGDSFVGSNVIGMPGISSAAAVLSCWRRWIARALNAASVGSSIGF
jgi:cell division inhibitor SepF